MSERRPNKSKPVNPLRKPWVKTAAKAVAPLLTVAKSRAVFDDENKIYGENSCRVLF